MTYRTKNPIAPQPSPATINPLNDKSIATPAAIPNLQVSQVPGLTPEMVQNIEHSHQPITPAQAGQWGMDRAMPYKVAPRPAEYHAARRAEK